MRPAGILYGGALLILLLLALLLLNREDVRHPGYQDMTAAAEKSWRAFQIIKTEKEALGLDTAAHASGMIGAEYTGITTTLGPLESKRTSAHPAFSGVIYLLIEELGLKPGAKIAFNLSGSFPALNIQAIITAELMGYEPVILSSLGASTYGANQPEMTYPHMEAILFERGLIRHRSGFVSPGGHRDIGTGMAPGLLDPILNSLEDRGYHIFREKDYKQNLETRLKYYRGCRALINVGGNYVSQTGADIGYRMDYGFIPAGRQYNYESAGLIGAFLASGRDVINFLNIKSLALRYNLPIDADGPYRIGSGGVYYAHQRYSTPLCVIIGLVFIATTAGYCYVRKKSIDNDLDQIIQQELMG